MINFAKSKQAGCGDSEIHKMSEKAYERQCITFQKNFKSEGLPSYFQCKM